MKTIFSLCLTALCLITLVGCQKTPEEPPFIWAENFTEFPITPPEYKSTKDDLAPQASKFVLGYFQAFSEQKPEIILDMLGIDNTLLQGVDFKQWVTTVKFPTTAGTEATVSDIVASLASGKCKVSSSYNDSNAEVVLAWGEKETAQSVSIPVKLLELETPHLKIESTAGFNEMITVRIPGTVTSINGLPMDKYITAKTVETNEFVFPLFPMADISVVYTNNFAEQTEVLAYKDGLYTTSPLLTDDRARAQYVLAANTLINDVWHTYVAQDWEKLKTLIGDQTVVNELIHRRPDVNVEAITFVEVTTNADQKPEDDYVIAGNRIHLGLKYLTKLNLGLGSISSCKDYTWIEMSQDADSNWHIESMNIEGRHSILTYLDETNNEW